MVVAGALAFSAVPGRAGEKGKAEKKEDKTTDPNMWSQPERVGRGRYMRLTEEEIGRIMEGIKKDNPKKAKQLEDLQTLDEEKFRKELRDYAQEEFNKIMRERFNKYRQRRTEEFLKWLDKEYPREAKALAKLKPKDAEVYNKKYELVRKKYRYIHDAWRRNEELGKVLQQDLRLKNRRDSLRGKLKKEKDGNKKKALEKQLEEVVADRFDLIVRRKQIILDELLEKIKELQKRISDQKNEIKEWRNPKFRKKAIEERIKELIAELAKFNWN
jgi:hypothetical protein